MAELLFIATTVFVAYVLYEVVSKKTDKPELKQPVDPVEKPPLTSEAVAEKTAPPSEVLSETVKAKPVAKSKAAKAKPAAKTTAAKPKKTPPKKPSPAPAAATADSLKNPKTGEVAKIPNNYAFAKRWIKEALVEEGLLDKIYKSNELDTDAKAKINDALQQLIAMEKYQ